MTRKKYAVLVLCMSFFLSPNCKEKDQQDTPAANIDNKDIVYPMLYQKRNSLNDALVFIEAREDKLESYISSVGEKRELVNQDQLNFANKLFSLRTSKDTEFFISLLSEKANEQLKDDNKNGILIHHIEEIKNGTFLYGEYDFKFFATLGKLSKEEHDKLQNVDFTETPTHNIVYWHFHKPKNMLIGSTYYLIEDEDSYKIVTETLPKDKIPPINQK